MTRASHFVTFFGVWFISFSILALNCAQAFAASPSKSNKVPHFQLETSHRWNAFDYRHQEVFAPGGMHVFSNRLNRKETLIVLFGQIPLDSVAQAFELATADRDTVWIALDSIGGNSAEAEEIARIILELSKPRGISRKKTKTISYVPNHAESQSAATIIFLAAQQRMVHPGAVLGVHATNIAGNSDSPQRELMEWAGFGLPLELGKIILAEGFFNPASPARIIPQAQLLQFGMAQVGEIKSIEQVLGKLDLNCEKALAKTASLDWL